MRKFAKKLTALTMAGVLALGMNTMVFAAEPAPVERDEQSGFAISGEEATSGITSFKIYKDYDAVNEDAVNPAEVFEYKITPYYVWNSGSLFNGGVETVITAENMPMLEWQKDASTKVSAVVVDGVRTLTVTQSVDKGAAKVPGDTE